VASSILLGFSYLCVVVFVAAVAWRAVRICRLPIHLRWELYPVAHEKGRASYGGSYLEEAAWWSKRREFSLFGELKVMIPEILLLVGVWEHNRKYWFRTFPFHFGLYVLAGLLGLLLLGGILVAAGLDVAADGWLVGRLLYYLTCVLGYAGLVLGLVGAVALLAKRLYDPDYREYTRKADYFNLGFFVVTFVVALAAQLVADQDFAVLRGYFARLLTFGLVSADLGIGRPSGLGVAEIVLGCLLLAYIPLTHMSHFFTKWFTYHDVRWSDEPNLTGGEIERQVDKALRYPVSWSAAHIRGDGKKSWAEVATSEVEEEKQ
jgi:nitrate reductase gamma subunit